MLATKIYERRSSKKGYEFIMNQKDFLRLEEEVKIEKFEKQRVAYEAKLRKLEKEEEVLLSASKLKQRYRSIYCGYHLEKSQFFTLFGVCLFVGILILREVFHMTADWRIRSFTLVFVAIAPITCSIITAISTIGTIEDFTKEGLYKRLIDIQTKKKNLHQSLDDLQNIEDKRTIKERNKDNA